jgi:hypothetical protein
LIVTTPLAGVGVGVGSSLLLLLFLVSRNADHPQYAAEIADEPLRS